MEGMFDVCMFAFSALGHGFASDLHGIGNLHGGAGV